jgi:hypothetical protein
MVPVSLTDSELSTVVAAPPVVRRSPARRSFRTSQNHAAGSDFGRIRLADEGLKYHAASRSYD